MGFDWSVHIHPDYLHIECEGLFALSDAKRVAEACYEMAAEHDKSKVLLDWRKLAGAVTDTDRYEMGAYVAKVYIAQQPFRYVRLAVLGNEPILSPDRLGQLAARNRGAHGIVTDRLEEAMRFLEVEG